MAGKVYWEKRGNMTGDAKSLPWTVGIGSVDNVTENVPMGQVTELLQVQATFGKF